MIEFGAVESAAPIASQILVAKSPGPMAADPGDLPWTKLPAGMTSEAVVAASRAAWSDPPAPATPPPPAADVAEFLLAQFDVEIARLEHNLRIVRRRKETLAAAIKGARFAPPQHVGGSPAAAVGWRT
mgnify:CR=1 FL=1